MNDRARTVGVTGEDAESVAERLASDGLAVTVDTPEALAADGRNGADLDLAVAIGATAIGEFVAAGSTVPLVPVDAGAGIRGVPRTDVDSLAIQIRTDSWELEDHHPYAVTVDDERVGPFVFDLTLLTAEAARISEYTVVADGEHVDTARADGVVIATPAGSTDYARRVHAPILGPEAGIAVAWIAPFRADPDRWVLQPSTLALRVERDEAAVDLVVDGRVVRTVGPETTIRLDRADPFAVAVFPSSRDRYA